MESWDEVKLELLSYYNVILGGRKGKASVGLVATCRGHFHGLWMGKWDQVKADRKAKQRKWVSHYRPGNTAASLNAVYLPGHPPFISEHAEGKNIQGCSSNGWRDSASDSDGLMVIISFGQPSSE